MAAEEETPQSFEQSARGGFSCRLPDCFVGPFLSSDLLPFRLPMELGALEFSLEMHEYSSDQTAPVRER